MVCHHVMQLAGDPGALCRRGAGHVVIPLRFRPLGPAFRLPDAGLPVPDDYRRPPRTQRGQGRHDGVVGLGMAGRHLGLDAADHHQEDDQAADRGAAVDHRGVERDGVSQRERGVREGELVIQDARDPGHDEHRERPSPAPRERHALGDDQHERGPERVQLAAVGQHRRGVDEDQGQRQGEVLDPRRERGGPGRQPRHDLAVHDLIVWRGSPGGILPLVEPGGSLPGGRKAGPRAAAPPRCGAGEIDPPPDAGRPPTGPRCWHAAELAHGKRTPVPAAPQRAGYRTRKPPACWPAPAARPGWASSLSPPRRSRSRWR